jgi:hypothetical protein
MSVHVDSTSREMSCNTPSSLTSSFRTESRNTSETQFDRTSQRLGGMRTTQRYAADPADTRPLGEALSDGGHGGAAARG